MGADIQLRDAVLFDMDGTLCDVRSIRHLLQGPGSFDAFHLASANCPPHQWVVDAARQVHEDGMAVLIVTARKWRYRNLTAMWLALNNIPSDAMWMRRDDDARPDFLVKQGILRQIRRRYNPIHAYDDRPEVCDLWEREDIPVTRVPGWEETIRAPSKAVQLSWGTHEPDPRTPHVPVLEGPQARPRVHPRLAQGLLPEARDDGRPQVPCPDPRGTDDPRSPERGPVMPRLPQLVQVGWYCWRCHKINATACRSDAVPIHVPAEWAEDMEIEIAKRENAD